jgi:hypothetical protein
VIDMNTHPNVTITGYTSIPAGEYRSRSTVPRTRTRSFSPVRVVGQNWRRSRSRRFRPTIGSSPLATNRTTRIEHSRWDAQFRSF